MLYSSHSSSFFSDLLLLVIAIRLIYKINLFVLKTIGIEIHRIEWKSIIIVMLSMPIGNVSSTTILVGSYLNAPLIVCLSVGRSAPLYKPKIRPLNCPHLQHRPLFESFRFLVFGIACNSPNLAMSCSVSVIFFWAWSLSFAKRAWHAFPCRQRF